MQLGRTSFKVGKVTGRASGRRRGAIRIRRKEAAVVADLEADLGGSRRPGKHGSAIVGTQVRAHGGLSVGEQVISGQEGGVGGGWPDCQFRVIVQRGSKIVSIESVGAGGVVGSGDRDTLLVVVAADADDRNQPAVNRTVVQNDGVAAIAATGRAERIKYRAELLRIAGKNIAVLVINRVLHVHRLHDVIRPHRQVGIRGRGTIGADTVKMNSRGSVHQRAVDGLQHRICHRRASRTRNGPPRDDILPHGQRCRRAERERRRDGKPRRMGHHRFRGIRLPESQGAGHDEAHRYSVYS